MPRRLSELGVTREQIPAIVAGSRGSSMSGNPVELSDAGSHRPPGGDPVILLAGLTPAWQQTLVFDAFTPGEVNRAREVYWNASGKVLNAAAAVRWLGGDGLAVAPVGGPAVAAFDRELDALGIRRRWIATESSTRVCTTILDRARGTMTELVENGRPLAPAELEAYLAAYAEEAARADVAVMSGSLPLGTPDEYYRELVRRTPCPAVLDFRGPGLLGVLDLKPLVVKPNRQELAETLGRPLDTDEELRSAMRELNRRGAQWVIVTQGGGPVWLSSADKPPSLSAADSHRHRQPTRQRRRHGRHHRLGSRAKAATYPKPSASASPPPRTTSATSSPAGLTATRCSGWPSRFGHCRDTGPRVSPTILPSWLST